MLSTRNITCARPANAASRRQTVVRTAAQETATPSYFIVNNVFKVKDEFKNDFEETWKSRESHLKEMDGFVRFAMLKCTNVPGKYISQTFWRDEAAFRAWTQSQQFQASHGGGKKPDGESAPSKRPPVMAMLDGPPQPEMFETVTVTEL